MFRSYSLLCMWSNNPECSYILSSASNPMIQFFACFWFSLMFKLYATLLTQLTSSSQWTFSELTIVIFFYVSTRAFKFIEKQAFIIHSDFCNTGNKGIHTVAFFHLTKVQKAPINLMIRTWNSLPSFIRTCWTMKSFKSKLKENLYLQCYRLIFM